MEADANHGWVLAAGPLLVACALCLTLAQLYREEVEGAREKVVRSALRADPRDNVTRRIYR